MEIRSYGMILRRLQLEDIEWLRCLRNSAPIRSHMVFQQEITPEMQLKWFNEIDLDKNYFFVAISEENRVGLADLKKIDWFSKTAQVGLIMEPDCWATDLSFRVAFSLLDFGFFTLKLKTIQATILSDNKNAYSFNSSLGFVDAEVKDNLVERVCDEEAYLKATQRRRVWLQKKPA